MGTWRKQKREAKECQVETTLEPEEAEELIEGLEAARQKSSLPEWLDGMLERFERGFYSAVWIAKRLIGNLLHQVIDRFRGGNDEL